MEAPGYQPFGSVSWFAHPPNAADASPPRGRPLLGEEAVESFAAEVVVCHALGVGHASHSHAVLKKLVPAPEHVSGRKKDIMIRADLAMRGPPHREPESDEEDTPLVWACKTYRGKAVKADTLAATSPRDRLSKGFHFVSNDADEGGVWVHPPTDETGHPDGIFALPDNAYGARENMDADIRSIGNDFALARTATRDAIRECLSQQGIIGTGHTTIGSATEAIKSAYARADLNAPFPVSESYKSTITRLMCSISVRMRHLKEGIRANESIQRGLERHRVRLAKHSAEDQDTAITLRNTFSTDDLMKTVVDHFGPYDAGRLLRTCKWGSDITKLLKDRFPRLHIYKIPGIFPHHADASGTGYMHVQTQFKVAVGLIYTKKREPLEDGLVEKDPGEAYRPGLQCYDAVNTLASSKNVASWTSYDQPWDAENKRTSIHPSMFFQGLPTLKITLVDADHGNPIVPLEKNNLHGGLTPDKVMARLEAKGERSRLMWNLEHTPQNPTATFFRGMRNPDFATMSKFKATMLSSRIGCKVRIRAEASGYDLCGRPLTLKTESEPLTIVSSLAVAKKVGCSSKRKR